MSNQVSSADGKKKFFRSDLKRQTSSTPTGTAASAPKTVVPNEKPEVKPASTKNNAGPANRSGSSGNPQQPVKAEKSSSEDMFGSHSDGSDSEDETPKKVVVPPKKAKRSAVVNKKAVPKKSSTGLRSSTSAGNFTTNGGKQQVAEVKSKTANQSNKNTVGKISHNVFANNPQDKIPSKGYGSGDTPPADDTDSEGFDDQVFQLMEQLETKVEGRIRQKQQKLSKTFEGVLTIPSLIEKFGNEQGKLHNATIRSILATLDGLNKTLQEVLKLQKENAQKYSKVMAECAATRDETKKMIIECKVMQAAVITKYIEEEKKCQGRLASEEKQFVEQSNKEIIRLQRRLILEGQKQESDAVTNRLI